jgi:hypothetical protein
LYKDPKSRARDLGPSEKAEVSVRMMMLANKSMKPRGASQKPTKKKKPKSIGGASAAAFKTYARSSSSVSGATTPASGGSGGTGGKKKSSYFDNRPGARNADQVFAYQATDLVPSPETTSRAVKRKAAREDAEALLSDVHSVVMEKHGQRAGGVRYPLYCVCV